MAADSHHEAEQVALVRAAQRGDTLALNDLLDVLIPYVGRICAAIALDSGPDAAQETLMTLMGSLRGLRDPAALFGWVRTVAVREAIRHARRDTRVAATETDVLEQLPGPADPQLDSDVRAVLARLSPEHRAVLILRDLYGHDEAATAALLDVSHRHRQISPAPRAGALSEGMDGMTGDWPTIELDPVRRLRAAAAGVTGAHVTERIIDAPLERVWAILGDIEGGFRRIQPDMRTIRVVTRNGYNIQALARSRYGPRARLYGVLRPGWCWLQSRHLIIAMAASEQPDGRTRVALTGGIRLPHRAAILPIGVRREAAKSLDRLEAALRPPHDDQQ